MEVPKTKTRGRQKIEMKKVENQKKRLVAFTKRRQGLFKKASELSELCGAKTALVVFSENGKPYSCGDVDAVFDDYLTGKVPEIDKAVSSLEEDKEKKPVEEEKEKGIWWEKTVEGVMLESLMEYEAALKELKKNVEAELEERGILKAQANAASSSLTSSNDHDLNKDVTVNVNAHVHGHDEIVDHQCNGENYFNSNLGGFGGDGWFF